jgi:hypothetical protein
MLYQKRKFDIRHYALITCVMVELKLIGISKAILELHLRSLA